MTEWELKFFEYLDACYGDKSYHVMKTVKKAIVELTEELTKSHKQSDGWSFHSDIKYALKSRGIE